MLALDMKAKKIMGFDVDTEVEVIYLKTRTRQRLMFCGTPCWFHDAVWLNNDILVVPGSGEALPTGCPGSPAPCPYVPEMYVVDFKQGTVTWYTGPQVMGYDGWDYWDRKLRKRLPGFTW